MRDDAAEFAQFYEQNRAACSRAVRAVVRDPDLAEDLVAESFARAWASWHRLRGHPAPQAWIVRTCLNTHTSWWRRRRRESVWPPALDPSGSPSDLEPVDAGLIATLRGLPERQREVVVLRVFLDLDTEATARALGIAAGTVRAHMHRALARLRTCDAVLSHSTTIPRPARQVQE